MINPYTSQDNPVSISDPSGRLQASGMTTFYFPYTPTITVISSAGYSSYDVSHSNFQQRAFEMASNVELSIAVPFVVENEEQGQYLQKTMLFFRGAMKMRFGKQDPNRGLPPPILRFNAYGMYENVPVLLRDFTHNLDSDIDYLELSDGTKVPVVSNLVFSLTSTYAPKNVRDNFTMEKYISGSLKGSGYV